MNQNYNILPQKNICNIFFNSNHATINDNLDIHYIELNDHFLKLILQYLKG